MSCRSRCHGDASRFHLFVDGVGHDDADLFAIRVAVEAEQVLETHGQALETQRLHFLRVHTENLG